ncbi:hypothetical protein [Methylibium sp.]|uniref:hypothetical protein n=1 Tax=Methylibium sp. TaxID=2067992 RepID=UPI003BA9A122
MCTDGQLWSTLLFMLLVAAAIPSAVFQHRFLVQLESQHPKVWSTLGKRTVLTEDGNTSYASAQWYLLTGEFATLPDSALVAQGMKARAFFLVTAVALVAWGVAAVLANASPRLACISRVLHAIGSNS